MANNSIGMEQQQIVWNNNKLSATGCNWKKKSIGIIPEFPLHLDQIMRRKENFKTIEPNLKDVQEYIIKSMRML